MRLSICIPTYNREKYIVETLQTALEQATDDVEIVVCDNASADNTQQVVEALFAGRRNVRYFRWPENMGADRNFLKVVELSTADYCWFMGSDDKIEPGAIAHVLEALARHAPLAGMSVNRHAYDSTMTQRILERPVAGGQLRQDRLLTDADDIGQVLGEYFGYIPGQIVNRTLWAKIAERAEVPSYFNAYVHVYIIGQMTKVEPRWLYVARPCVGWRSGNDSFLVDGRLRRLAIDVYGLERIARDVYGTGSRAYRAITRTVVTVHVFYAVLGAKVEGAPFKYLRDAFMMTLRTYWRVPAFWWKTLPLFFAPSALLRLLRSLYQATLKRARLARL